MRIEFDTFLTSEFPPKPFCSPTINSIGVTKVNIDLRVIRGCTIVVRKFLFKATAKYLSKCIMLEGHVRVDTLYEYIRTIVGCKEKASIMHNLSGGRCTKYTYASASILKASFGITFLWNCVISKRTNTYERISNNAIMHFNVGRPIEKLYFCVE